MVADTVLRVEDLSIDFGRGRQARRVVSDVSLTLRRGETLALVGESGSGKTLTGRALLRLLPKGAGLASGRATLSAGGTPVELFAIGGRGMRQVRGKRIAMIFQEPMSSLSPLHTIGDQVSEMLTLHASLSGAEARRRTLDTFAEVGFPDPERAWSAYPFELSGGLRQRAMIAMAMICRPEIIIADEPTTALDVTTQAQVLDLIARLQAETGMSMIMVTHDLGVVANIADSVVVMRRGSVVESGPARAVLTRPGHGYTRALLAAAPEIPRPAAEPDAVAVAASVRHPAARPAAGAPVIAARNLSKTYPASRGRGPVAAAPFRAVADVSLSVARGETLAIVGESGSGKSTVAKLLLRAEEPDPGAEILFTPPGGPGAGQPVAVQDMDRGALRDYRRRVQMVFQDPFASLSPRMSVLDILTEPLRIHRVCGRAEQRERAADMLDRVGLSPDHLGRFPHAFSGGQRQRIGIARALMLRPDMLICDEPTSALDVSVQAQVLDLLKDLRAEMGLSYLFISHNLAVVADLADRVAVMRRGRVLEEAPVQQLFEAPNHPYTAALIAACPEPDMDRRLDLAAVARGAGDPETWPPAYAYRGDAAPALSEIAPGHYVRRAS